jgi:hypothetical protein
MDDKPKISINKYLGGLGWGLVGGSRMLENIVFLG